MHSPDDHIAAQWYRLFLDLWNQRYRIEQQPREWLEDLWRRQGGRPLDGEEPSVIVTSLLLMARAEFEQLDRAARDQAGQSLDLPALREQAQNVHDRWVAQFRQPAAGM